MFGGGVLRQVHEKKLGGVGWKGRNSKLSQKDPPVEEGDIHNFCSGRGEPKKKPKSFFRHG